MSGLLDNRRWDVLPTDEVAASLLCREVGVTPLVARVLISRGITDPRSAREFLNPSLERDWADPLDIPGMGAAADRVEAALAHGERIAVFGDFDVDGMTSTCLLTQALRTFGGDVHPYIPHRFGEGYGLSDEALHRVIDDCHPDLIITVDNGIAARREVRWLLGQGVDVVVTDHHEPGDLVPEGVPVTDPKMSATCASRELAGAGVALKLVCELGRRLGMPELWREHTDLAALGTVSDMMLLQGENRSLVHDGLDRMRHSTRPGILALAATSGAELGRITADTLPFTLIPRLNAAGRMGTTEVAFDLLISEDHAQAAALAAALERTNNERRATESRLSSDALSRLKRTYDGERVIVLGGEGWHEGVKGIVASRVVSLYHVPTIIFSISDGMARGSGRSVGTVDLFHAVEQCSDILVRFGGHAGAVGVTCEEERLDDFRERLQEVMSQLPTEQFEDRGEVSAMVGLEELDLAGIDALETLQPFGQGNKRPLLGVCGVYMRGRSRVGQDGSHLRFVATNGASSLPAIMFRAPGMERACACDGLVDLVVDAVNETWQGRTQPKLMVRDILYRSEPLSLQPDRPPVEHYSQPTHAGKAIVSAGRAAGLARNRRERLGGMGANELTDALRRHLIGDHPLLPAQRQALERLADGRSVMCVMATGRGKSLIFHLHAARIALRDHKASVFVFPLRALVSDQAFHLQSSLGELGMHASVLTGETPSDQRKRVFEDLRSGEVDILLTTPEFLAIHAARFAQSARVGFLVVDEAHHAGAARGGNRAAYTELPRVLEVLGNPQVLAVTATASDEVAHEVCRLAHISEQDVLVDLTTRPNLHIVDNRELRDRDLMLASVVSRGDKTVVYVNSRGQAQSITRLLRSQLTDLAPSISYYHAGLPRPVRRRVEEAFRADRLCCIVSTSAFGEGVNLPGIRNVVLYHMPFGSTEFNQMSGRAGRDGRDAQIHLLFGSRDVRTNERILSSSAPARGDLAVLYRALMTEWRQRGARGVGLSDAELVRAAQQINGGVRLNDAAVSCGVAVFGELGFLQVEGYGDGRLIRMSDSPAHVDLASSIRYAEGRHALAEFERFKDWALSSRPTEMLGRVNKPIAPEFGHTVDQ